MALLLFAGIFLLRRRSKRRKPALDVLVLDRTADQSAYVFTGGMTELDSGMPSELDTGYNRAELH